MKIATILIKAIGVITELVFPKLCLSCEFIEPLKDEELCLLCITTLPKIDKKNDVMASLIGASLFPREIEHVYALYYFTKPGKVQDLIHRIKYDSRIDLAHYFGRELGKQIRRFSALRPFLVPVPLHPKRYKARGYNQAFCIAEGISQELGCTIDTSIIKRVKYRESQASLDFMGRESGLENSFEAIPISTGDVARFVMLIDDVITTGATIKACYEELVSVGYSRIAVASLAISV